MWLSLDINVKTTVSCALTRANSNLIPKLGKNSKFAIQMNKKARKIFRMIFFSVWRLPTAHALHGHEKEENAACFVGGGSIAKHE